MAKDKVSLPASYGGLLRYDEALSAYKLEPGHVVALILVISGALFLLQLLG